MVDLEDGIARTQYGTVRNEALQMQIPITRPVLGGEEGRCGRRGVGIAIPRAGPQVAEFERLVAEMVGPRMRSPW